VSAPPVTPLHALIDFAPGRADAPPLRAAFGAPRRVLVAQAPAEVRAVLDAAEAEAQAGRWCVGWLRYEAAAAFDAAFQTHPADGPLAWFGVHDRALPLPPAEPDDALADWHGQPSRPSFDAAIAEIHRAIADGELYQVNLTAPLQGRLREGSARALFDALRRAQPQALAAYIDSGAEQVLSVSPELFFDWRHNSIQSHPMKGTAPRGATPEADAALADALRTSPKERAENLMIVDLIRNDLSRIAEPFSVQVPRLFECQAWPTVWQMVSVVQARPRAGITLADVFAALFPCGSVTGAPKVQAMRLIRRLEPGPRGIYCGAVGVLQPGGAATFNVPIRTLQLRGSALRCGIGSGITADARAEGEWAEWRTKRAFVERASVPFELLETMRLEDGRLHERVLHTVRLARAAAHFGFQHDGASVDEALARLAATRPQGLWRLRLLLDARGRITVEAHAHVDAHTAATGTPTVQLAPHALVEADGEFVRFKTTRRAHYDALAPTDPAVFDTLLWNARGELTEFTRGNVAVKLDGRWVTPPLACGLLDGIGRAAALRDGRLTEAVVRVDNLPRAEAIAFVNSLRGWIEVVLG
jgi:para-aminobenzoate synthetase/4-amino-4-deoxychorismate lyase